MDREQEQKLAEYEGPDRVISSTEYGKILELRGTPSLNVQSGIFKLDYYLDGFEGGELIVVSGSPKSGKTLLGQTMTVNLVKQGVKSLWFTYEVRTKQFLERFPGEVKPVFWLPLEHKANKIEWVREKICEAVVKYDIKVCFIDHLHFLFSLSSSRSPSLEIGDIIRKLKETCIEYNVVIVLMVHQAKIRQGEKPSAENCRDSSLIIQESDTTIILWRIKDDEKKNIINRAKLSVEMSRRTGVMRKEIDIVKQNGLLFEVERGLEEDV